MTMTSLRRHPARLFLISAILVLFFWLGLKGCRIAGAVRSLQARQVEAETLMAGGLAQIDPDAVEALVTGIRADVVTLQSETAVFMPLAPYLAWLPRIGPMIAVSPHLMTLADAGTETAVHALRGFKPALSILQTHPPDMELLPALVQVVDQARPELAAMSLSLDRAVAARGQINDVDALPWRVRTLIGQLDEWLPLAQDGLKLAPHLPQVMGMDGPRRYLILAQNEDELRPTGGFISGAGLLVVENGRILDLSFLDATQVDNWQEKPYEFPPQPLYDLMALELFLFRDANFWPDFPTSAEKAMALYKYGQDTPELDGALAVDQQFMRLLLEAIGPVSELESGQIIDSDNIVEYLQAAWAIRDDQAVRDWIFNRKAFIGLFAAAILAKIESNFADVDPVLLSRNMMQAIETKHLQVYMRDPAISAVLNELHWDGRLPDNPQHDFLMAVDTNVGYTKANALVTRSLAYQVRIRADGTAEAEATVTYQHGGVDTGGACTQDVVYNLETAVDYQTLVDRCYWPYLRLYVPYGSQLQDSSRHVVRAEATISGGTWDGTAQAVNDLGGLTAFANYMVVPRGRQINSFFSYQLPPVIRSNNGQNQYRLDIFKQAGTRSQPVSVTITLPEQAVVDRSTPAPTRIEGETLYFEFPLEKDTFIIVDFH